MNNRNSDDSEAEDSGTGEAARSGGPPLKRLLGEASSWAEPIRRLKDGGLLVEKAAHPRPVMLLPGFGTHPIRMKYMGSKLVEAGHQVIDWGLGWNLGPTPERIEQLQSNLREFYEAENGKVALVGWSLGGLFAREIAKREAEAVSLVVTMGSPFSGDPHDNNAWRAYQLITGHSVEDAPMAKTVSEKPPVPTVALWSARDGIVAPRAACGKPFERDRAEALRCTHLGFANSAEAITAVLRALDKDAL